MNDFNGLQTWACEINKPRPKTKEQVIDEYKQYPWFRRSMSKKEESSNSVYISILLADCKQSGKLIRESDGQFTGGYSVEVSRYNDEVLEFGYQDGKLCNMTRFDGELY